MNATANFETENASRHLTMLCKHFSRRVPTEHNGQLGTIEFPFGCCQMSAHEHHLTFEVSASNSTERDQVVDVVTRHLERFAFRENPQLEWQLDTNASKEGHSLGKDNT